MCELTSILLKQHGKGASLGVSSQLPAFMLQILSILRVNVNLRRYVASENCINNLDNFILIVFTRIVL